MGFGDSWSTFFRRMPWFLQYYMILLPLAMSMVAVVDSGRKLPPIYWNATNEIFNITKMSNEIDINLGDSIDIICPQYHYGTSVTDMEYYVIYMVTKAEYDRCMIYNTTRVQLLVNCSYPTYNPAVMYTLLIKKFQSIPGNPDFQPGQKYYFITTSGGSVHAIDNQVEGACKHKNMKLTMNVCCGDGTVTPKPTPNVPPVTPVRTSPRPPVTSRRPTTTKTTTTTTTITTSTTMRRTTPRTNKPNFTQGIPGHLPDENVIHAGGNGPKNVGLINDNSGHRTSLSMASLVLLVLAAYLFR